MKKVLSLIYIGILTTGALGLVPTFHLHSTTKADFTVSVLVTNSTNKWHEPVILVCDTGNGTFSWFSEKNPQQAVNLMIEKLSKIKLTEQDMPPTQVTDIFMAQEGQVFIINTPQFIPALHLKKRGARVHFKWVSARVLLSAPASGKTVTVTDEPITIDPLFLEKFKKAWPHIRPTPTTH